MTTTITLEKIQSFLQTIAPYVLGIVLGYGLAFLPRQTPAVMIVCAIILLLIARKHIALPKPASQGLAIIALLYIVASALWSDSPRALEMVRDLGLIGSSALVLCCVRHDWGQDFMAKLMHTFAIAFVVATLAFSINVVLDFPYQRFMGMKLSAGYVNYWESNIPKRSGVLFSIYLWPVALYAYSIGKRRLAYTLMGFTLFTVGLSYSRAALLAHMAALVMFAIAVWRVRLAQWLGFILMPAGFVLVLALGLTALHTIRPVVYPYISPSGDYRFFIWNYAAHESLNHMPFGIGIDGSRVLDDSNATDRAPLGYQDGDLLPNHPHNVFLQIWLELGIMGAGILSALLFFVWRWMRAQAPAAQPFLWAYATAAVVTLGIAYGAWQSWWIGGQALAAILMHRVVEMKYGQQHNT